MTVPFQRLCPAAPPDQSCREWGIQGPFVPLLTPQSPRGQGRAVTPSWDLLFPPRKQLLHSPGGAEATPPCPPRHGRTNPELLGEQGLQAGQGSQALEAQRGRCSHKPRAEPSSAHPNTNPEPRAGSAAAAPNPAFSLCSGLPEVSIWGKKLLPFP